MITIRKGQANTVIFTLNERTTLDPVIYLLELYSKQNHSSQVLLLGTDQSGNKLRYNEFIITEDDNEDLYDATISLLSGEYTYYVWQASPISPQSLDTADAESIIESGRCVVPYVEPSSDTFDDPETEYTFT